MLQNEVARVSKRGQRPLLGEKNKGQGGQTRGCSGQARHQFERWDGYRKEEAVGALLLLLKINVREKR